MEVVRVGFIGLGMRGPGAVERFTHIEGTEIKALCDLYPERAAAAQEILKRPAVPTPRSTAVRKVGRSSARETTSTSSTS